MSVRQILSELAALGHDVRIIGATIFDSPKGVSFFGSQWAKITALENETFVDVNDGRLTHSLLVTDTTDRSALRHSEITTWVMRYRQEIKYFKPEFIFFYGGGPGDFISAEARAWNIPCGAYLVNGTFSGHRWCRDIDTFITDTHATRDYYRNKLNINPIPIGKFIENDKIAKVRNPETLLYVNPSLAKGACIVVMIAELLRNLGSGINIEVVESRGDWDVVLKAVNRTLGWPEDYCPENIKVVPNTVDMAAVYARTKVLFVPSLWWESGARVIAEAQLNGIPVVATHYGGNPEMVGAGGATFSLPPVCHEEPYLTVPNMDGLKPIADKLIEIFSDDKVYNQLSKAALANAKLISGRRANAEKFETHIKALVEQKKPWQSKVYPNPSYQPYDPQREYAEVSIYEPLAEDEKGIFIDCGGYDGCSAIKFIADNPNFDCITFEPNPELWHYYETVPTTLIKKGVAGEAGQREFTIDSIDYDGSSLVKDKKIDFRGIRANEDFPKIIIDCVDIEDVISKLSQYNKIILKLDVEGAEYEILERMLQTGSISRLSKLYIEWHWEKCDIPFEHHLDLFNRVRQLCEVENWDALDMSIHNRGEDREKERLLFINRIIKDPIAKYQEHMSLEV